MFSLFDKHRQKIIEIAGCAVYAEWFRKIWKKIIQYSGKSRFHVKEVLYE